MRSILSLCTVLILAFAITGCGPSEELVKLKADTEAAYARSTGCSGRGLCAPPHIV